MSELLQKIKLLFIKLKTREESYERGAVKPEYDWKIILITATVILFVLAIISFYFYIQVDKGALFVVNKDGTANEVKINMDLLQKTVNDIKLREAMTAKIRGGNTIVPTP